MLCPWNSSVKDMWYPLPVLKKILHAKPWLAFIAAAAAAHALCRSLAGGLRSWEYGLVCPFDLGAFELKALFRQALEVEGFGQSRFGYMLVG